MNFFTDSLLPIKVSNPIVACVESILQHYLKLPSVAQPVKVDFHSQLLRDFHISKLAKYLNPTYLNPNILPPPRIKVHFDEEMHSKQPVELISFRSSRYHWHQSTVPLENWIVASAVALLMPLIIFDVLRQEHTVASWIISHNQKVDHAVAKHTSPDRPHL